MLVSANEVDLCIQTFGAAGEPTILLIGGAESSMDWWQDEFCELLASGPRYVIRYDLRDTGQSVSYEPGAPGYDGSDLVADAVGVLDALGIARAHVVGISMGGGIGQHLALEHSGRVETLTLISTSPVGPRGPDKPGLPPMSEELASSFAEPAPEPDWSDREAVSTTSSRACVRTPARCPSTRRNNARWSNASSTARSTSLRAARTTGSWTAAIRSTGRSAR